jgi:hypothetical protein
VYTGDAFHHDSPFVSYAYWITSSALCSSDCGMVRPRAPLTILGGPPHVGP